MENYYDILGLKEDASDSDIRAAYDRLIKIEHTNKNQDPDQKTNRVQFINQAYIMLIDRKSRQEYDKLLRESKSESAEDSGDSQETDEGSEEVDCVLHACECCGKTDVILQYYVFAWVTSFLVFTRSGQKPFILCNACRFRKSLTYTLRVMLLGPWGVPWGILYSIAGILQNVFGGSCPKELNAPLLEAHGYALAMKGCGTEALECLEASNKYEPTLRKSKLIAYNSFIPPRTGKALLLYNLSRLNPAWALIPALVFLIWLCISAWPHLDSGNEQQHSTSQALHGVSDPSTDQLGDESKQVGFNLARFMTAVNTSNQIISQVNSYIHDRVTMLGTHKDGSSIIQDYTLDRAKLSNDDLERYAQNLKAQLVIATNLAVSAQITQTSTASRNVGLHAYVRNQLDTMRSSYYNVAVLAISVQYDKLGRAGDPHTLPISSAVKQIEGEPLFGDWLTRSGEIHHLTELEKRMSLEQQAIGMRLDIEKMHDEFDRDQSSLQKIDKKMDALSSAGKVQEYNALVPRHNELILQSNHLATVLLANAASYKSLCATLDKATVLDAFDDCMNENVLLASFVKAD